MLLLSPWFLGLRPKKLYPQLSDEVTPAHVRVHTQWTFVLSFTLIVGKAENLSPCPYAATDALQSLGLQPKKLYHTCSVTVTPAPVQVPTQGPLVPSFM